MSACAPQVVRGARRSTEKTRLPTNKSRQPQDPAASIIIEAANLVSSARVGKILNDMRDRFSGEQCVLPFAVHVTFKTADVIVRFSPSFLVVEGVSRIILSSSAIRARIAGNGKRTATLSDDFLRGTRASCSPITNDIEGARQARTRNNCNSDIRTRAPCGQAECAYLSHVRAVSSAQCCLGRGAPLNQARARPQKRRKMPLFTVEQPLRVSR